MNVCTKALCIYALCIGMNVIRDDIMKLLYMYICMYVKHKCTMFVCKYV